MAIADDIPRSWSLSSLAALVTIVVVPPWLAISAGASTVSVLAGAVIWFGSVMLKRFVVRGARRWSPWQNGSPIVIALMQGLVSAVVELAAAAAYLVTLPGATLIEVLGFGVGAGSAEAAYVLVLGVISPQVDEDVLRAWVDGATVSWCVRFAVPIERLFALIGHVGARGLLYVALMQATPLRFLWGVAAVSLFAAIDAVAVYGHMRRWRWHDPQTCWRAHSFFAALSLVEFALLIASFRE